MAADEQIRNRLAMAHRLLVLEIEHQQRVRAEQLDDSDAERAVRLRQAGIERMQRVLVRRAPAITAGRVIAAGCAPARAT